MQIKRHNIQCSLINFPKIDFFINNPFLQPENDELKSRELILEDKLNL